MLSGGPQGMVGTYRRSPGWSSLRHISYPIQSRNLQGAGTAPFFLSSPPQPSVQVCLGFHRHGKTDGMHGLMYGRKDACVGGCLDGRMDAHMDGWMSLLLSHSDLFRSGLVRLLRAQCQVVAVTLTACP